MEYPYLNSHKNLAAMLEQVRTAARPERLTHNELKRWGFASSQDRAFIKLLKELGFLTASGEPTDSYDLLRDPAKSRRALAESMRNLYADIFSINRNIHQAPPEDVKGAMARVTGADAKAAERFYRTFSNLTQHADFSAAENGADENVDDSRGESQPFESWVSHQQSPTELPVSGNRTPASFHYNIQIHLPATTDVSVYNAIFRAMRESLDI